VWFRTHDAWGDGRHPAELARPRAAARHLPDIQLRYATLLGPLRLLIRADVAAALSLLVLHLIPGTAAAPADVFGLIWWFVLTGRKDLAPPRER
jgi:hypothetical protein